MRAAAVLLAAASGAGASPASRAAGIEYVFPDDARIIDVKRDFGAKGDGRADDTAAITKAFVRSLEHDRYNPEFVYFPDGTYVVSDTLKNRVREGGWSDGWLVGIVMVGQSREGTVIRLRDRCPGYADPAKPKPVIKLASEMQGRKAMDRRPNGYGNCAFRNTIMNMTVDTGRGNAGAIGVAYLVSNRGSMEGVTIRSGDPRGAGHCGLEMTTPWPGPGLVRNVVIYGFDYGIRQDGMDCSMTFEHVTLTGQRKLAIEGSRHPTMSMRKIASRNAVPVFRSRGGGSGLIMFIDCGFTYTGADPDACAIYNQDNLFLQRVEVRRYAHAVKNVPEDGKGKDKYRPDLTLPRGQTGIDTYTSRDPVRLHPGPEEYPGLPVKETPVWHPRGLDGWVNVEGHGAGRAGKPKDFTSSVVMTRVDPKVDFGWGGGGPGGGTGNDNFSVRWTGEIAAPSEGEYTFYASINDNARLWVDGRLVIDKWEKYHSSEYSGAVRLAAGRRVPVRLDYYESGHDAWVRLAWSGPGVAKEVIPTKCLYPSAEAREPSGLRAQYYGKGTPDCLAAVQKAIDSGGTVVYFPNGAYSVKGTLVLRGRVRKLIGMEANLKDATVRVDDGVHETVFIEHLTGIKVVQNSRRTLVIQRCDLEGYENTEKGTGDVFIDDTMGSHPRINFPQDFWARQLNVEYGRKPLFVNNGGRAWILGMKTEGMFSQVVNNGGVVEVYALYSMTNPQPAREMPMIVNNEGFTAVSLADGGQKSFYTKFRDTWRGDTKEERTWRRETMMYIGGRSGER